MNWLDRLNRWVESQVRDADSMRVSHEDVLAQARLACRLEQYEQALGVLKRGEKMARQAKDVAGLADIGLHQGLVQLAKGDLDEAQACFEGVCSLQHASGGAWLAYGQCGLGEVAQGRGDWEKAQTYYEEGRRIAREAGAHGAEGRASGHLAGVSLHDGNAVFALHLLEKALPMLGEGADSDYVARFMLMMADAHEQMAHHDKARASRHHALFVASANRQIGLIRHINRLLADDAYRHGDYREANTHYHEVLRHTPAGNPDEGLLLVQARRAYCQHKLHQYDKARDTLAHLHDNSDDSHGEISLIRALISGHEDAGYTVTDMVGVLLQFKPPLHPLVWDVVGWLSDYYQECDEPVALKNLYDGLMQAWGEDAVAVARLEVKEGYLERHRHPEISRQRWSKALKVLQAHQQHDSSALLACDLGELYLALGDGHQAAHLYEQALLDFSHVTRDEIRGKVASNVGVAYSRLGNLDNAEAFLKMGLELAEKVQDIRASILRRGNYGIFLGQIGDPKPALHAIKEALKLAQDHNYEQGEAIQHNNLGYLHTLAGNFEGAEAAYEVADRQLGEIGHAYWLTVCRLNQGDLALRRGDNALASQHFERMGDNAIIRQNQPLRIRRALGQTQLLLGRGAWEDAHTQIEDIVADARKCRIQRLLVRALWLQVAVLDAGGMASEDVEQEATMLTRRIKGTRWVVRV